jgi:hypothetical protein
MVGLWPRGTQALFVFGLCALELVVEMLPRQRLYY